MSKSNPTDPVIIKTAFMVSSTAAMPVSPAFVVFLLPVLPEWQHKHSVKNTLKEVQVSL